ncbi:NAD(P)-binding protein [Xylariomycetidae sp. FL2044]|nr:NAD(P)-binding protein [Xylariomycetidae sp. FL2044]
MSNSQVYNLPDDAVWFVTGCSSGIGQALATFIATQSSSSSSPTTNQRIVATARDRTSLSAIPDGPNVLKLELDVTSRDSVDRAFEEALQRFGGVVDVVVNNAGYTLMGDTEAAGDEEARRVMDTNFWGAVDVAKRALGPMRESGRGGLILNVTSMGGYIASAGAAFYHASKFALEGFSASLGRELPPQWGIHVACLEPGGVRTNYLGSARMMAAGRHPAYDRNDDDEGGDGEGHYPTNAMLGFLADPGLPEHFARPEDIAKAVWRLVSGRRKIPGRVPLGRDSWGILVEETERIRKGFEEVRDVSWGVGREGQLEAMGGWVKEITITQQGEREQ